MAKTDSVAAFTDLYLPTVTGVSYTVALEATACGTPVVAADAGALTDSIIAGETGYRYPPGDREAFRRAIRRTLDERDRLSDLCLRRRRMLSVDHSLEQLAELYDAIRDGESGAGGGRETDGRGV